MTTVSNTLPASHAARRMACPGSHKLSLEFKQIDSNYSLEGEAAHWVAATYLQTGAMPLEGAACPNGEFVTEEMIEGAELFRDAIRRDAPHAADDDPFLIEESVAANFIHPDLKGRVDLALVSNDEIRIWDYKFGHAYVDVFENWQLIAYAAGVIETYFPEALRKLHNDIDVVLCIVQPRFFGQQGRVRTWRVSMDELFHTYFPRLRASEELAVTENAPCKPSVECGYCPARHACQALQKSTANIADIITNNSPNSLGAYELGFELKFLQRAQKLLKARVSGLEDEARALITSGTNVPYYRLESGQSREKWSRPVDEVVALGELYGLDFRKPVETITPGQATKMKGFPVDLRAEYVTRPAGERVLTQVDDREARKVFRVGGIDSSVNSGYTTTDLTKNEEKI